MFSDNMKIGVLLITLGFLFLFLGIMLFFDGGLLTVGNILLLAGFPFILGFSRSLKFFNPIERPEKRKGILCFFGGVVLVLFFRYAFIGIALELIGLVEMLAGFLPNVISTLRLMPVVGPWVDRVVEVPWVQSGLQRLVASSRPVRRSAV